jgi:Leucine Rich repeat
MREIQGMEPPSRSRQWRSWLQLAILGAFLTFAGLTVGNGGLPQVELYPKVEGISQADSRHLDEIKKLGGEAHFMERTPRFLGIFGGRDLLHYSFRDTAFDDEKLAEFVKMYGDRVWGLGLMNTSVTDAGLRHLASLPNIHDLALGSADPLPGSAPLPTQITDVGLVHLKGITSLRVLRLGDLPITDAGLDAIKDLPNLGGLYLWGTKVQGDGLGRLKSLPALAVLYLDRSAVTEEALSHLKGATNLQMLSLRGVPLTGRGLTYLTLLPKLKQLDINNCGLGFEDIDDFQVACPAVKLE